jgi:hypothetical protein
MKILYFIKEKNQLPTLKVQHNYFLFFQKLQCAYLKKLNIFSRVYFQGFDFKF